MPADRCWVAPKRKEIFLSVPFSHTLSVLQVVMDSLSTVLFCWPLHISHRKSYKFTYSKPFSPFSNHKPPDSAFQSLCSHQPHFPSIRKNSILLRNHPRNSLQKRVLNLQNTALLQNLWKSYFSFTFVDLFTTFPSFASEAVASSAEEDPGKINLESILVSIDDFFNRYPFFVAGCTFIWLVVIPLTQEYFRKYKFISAIDAFRKLRNDPNSQLLDIRDQKQLKFLKSPNLKILNKEVVQVEFLDGDEDEFVKKVLGSFKDVPNTVVCILDSVDGNSMKVAELLFKNGFKEAYAIKGGVKGLQGWMAIQDTLLPPSVHMIPRKKAKSSQQLGTNGGIQKTEDKSQTALFPDLPAVGKQGKDNGHVSKSGKPVPDVKIGSRASSSPYPNYPDLKPPSSPTPSKPK